MAKPEVPQVAYLLNQEGKDREVFTNAAKAGEAWHKADVNSKPMMLVEQPGQKVQIYARTGTSEGKLYKDLPFDNQPGSAEFKQSFKQSMELGKADFGKATLGKTELAKPDQNEVAYGMNAKHDMPAMRKAEDGKTYEGKIVSFNAGKVVQAVTDGKQSYFVEHARAALSGATSGLIAKDKDLSIRYAYAGVVVVVVKDKALERKVPEHEAKGFGGAGRY